MCAHRRLLLVRSHRTHSSAAARTRVQDHSSHALRAAVCRRTMAPHGVRAQYDRVRRVHSRDLGALKCGPNPREVSMTHQDDRSSQLLRSYPAAAGLQPTSRERTLCARYAHAPITRPTGRGAHERTCSEDVMDTHTAWNQSRARAPKLIIMHQIALSGSRVVMHSGPACCVLSVNLCTAVLCIIQYDRPWRSRVSSRSV